MLLKQLKLSSTRQFPEELRIFALTLNFYSSSAYNYVRNIFAKSLPHPKTLQKWYRAVDGSPGYTQESLRAITLKVDEMAKENKKLLVGLIMDEMAIKKHVQWNGQRQVGYVDLGIQSSNIDTDSLPEAKDALVFLLVAINSRWKIPIAYFLINGLSGKEKSNMVNKSIEIVHGTGAVVVSLTFDGAAANMTMSKELGANLSRNNLKSYFQNPVTHDPIFIFIDMCHVIKLLRNALGDWGYFLDDNNNYIK